MRIAMRVLVLISLPVVAFAWIGPATRAAFVPECGELRLLASVAPVPSCVRSPIEMAALCLTLIAIAAAGYAMFRLSARRSLR
jgi:hypothetical protein